MPLDLATLVDPAHTAVVTSECQVGVIGSTSMLPALAEAASKGMLPALVSLLSAARGASVQVVHCLFERRPDHLGSNTNARLFVALRNVEPGLAQGSPGAALVPEIVPDPSDLVLTRTHGLNPIAGTDLDPILRNLGVKTLVVTGVSVNIAVTNLVMDSINLGYQVVIPRDAVVGFPKEYADSILDNTLSLLATMTTTAELMAAWQ